VHSHSYESRTVKEFITAKIAPATGPGPASTLLWNGLRVRMGCHTGIADASEVAFNRDTGRFMFQGPCMALAKAVQDAAQVIH
jgi:hypothetical protein